MPQLVVDILQGKLQDAHLAYQALSKKGDNRSKPNGTGGLGKSFTQPALTKAFRIDEKTKTLVVQDYEQLFLAGKILLDSGFSLHKNENKAAICFALIVNSPFNGLKATQAYLELKKLYTNHFKTSGNGTDTNVLNLIDQNHHRKQPAINTQPAQATIEKPAAEPQLPGTSALIQRLLPAQETPQPIIKPTPIVPMVVSPAEQAEELVQTMDNMTLHAKIATPQEFKQFKKSQADFLIDQASHLSLTGLEALLDYLLSVQDGKVKDKRFDTIRTEEASPFMLCQPELFGNTQTWQRVCHALKVSIQSKLHAEQSSLLASETYDRNHQRMSHHTGHFLSSWGKTANQKKFENGFKRVEGIQELNIIKPR